jgi:hypothetical protein
MIDGITGFFGSTGCRPFLLIAAAANATARIRLSAISRQLSARQKGPFKGDSDREITDLILSIQ